MKPEPRHRKALAEAIRLKGGQSALAKAIGKDQGHIWFYLNEAKKFPPALAIKVEQVTEGRVPRWRLCPELEAQ